MNNNIEKFMIRNAYVSSKMLPDSILWRTKEAFSDGVGNEWVFALLAHAEKFVTEKEFMVRSVRFPHNTPQTKEAYWYRIIFEQLFPGQAQILPHYWLPKWNGDITDPSATVLDIHKKRNESD